MESKWSEAKSSHKSTSHKSDKDQDYFEGAKGAGIMDAKEDKKQERQEKLSSSTSSSSTTTPLNIPLKYSGSGSGGGALAFQRKTNNQFSKGGTPSSPTDSMLSPCTKKLRRKQSKKISNENLMGGGSGSAIGGPGSAGGGLDFWIPPDNVNIILGSSSASRGQILVDLGWNFHVVSPNLNEEKYLSTYSHEAEDPLKIPVLLAKEKCQAILKKMTDIVEPTVILTCDQIVLYRNTIRNKPKSRQEAKEFLMSYQQNEIIQTVSAVVATHVPSGKQATDIDICTIYWNGIPEDVIENKLLDKEEIYSSCGGFLIEDPDFLACIGRIDGDLDSIRGMPIKTTKRVFRTVLAADI